MIEYHVTCCSDPSKFEVYVQNRLDEGWELNGPLIVFPYRQAGGNDLIWYVQNLIRKIEPDIKEVKRAIDITKVKEEIK